MEISLFFKCSKALWQASDHKCLPFSASWCRGCEKSLKKSRVVWCQAYKAPDLCLIFRDRPVFMAWTLGALSPWAEIMWPRNCTCLENNSDFDGFTLRLDLKMVDTHILTTSSGYHLTLKCFAVSHMLSACCAILTGCSASESLKCFPFLIFNIFGLFCNYLAMPWIKPKL